MGLLWDHFGYMGVAVGHFRITLGSLCRHFGYMRVRFQKHSFSPIDFNHFIKLRSEIRVDVVLLRGHFWHMKVTLGPLWGHFGATLGI